MCFLFHVDVVHDILYQKAFYLIVSNLENGLPYCSDSDFRLQSLILSLQSAEVQTKSIAIYC